MQRLEVGLRDGDVVVEGTAVRPGWKVGELSAVFRGSGVEVRVPASGLETFSARLSLDELRHRSVPGDDVADLWLHPVPTAGGAASRRGTAEAPAPVRLGNFRSTTRVDVARSSGAGAADDRLAVTQNGNLSVLLGGAPARKFLIDVDGLRLGADGVALRLRVRGADRGARAARLVAASRETGRRYDFDVPLEEMPDESRRDRGRFVHRGALALPVSALVTRLDARDETLDLSVEVEDPEGRVQARRIGTRAHPVVLRPGRAVVGGVVTQLLPYETFRGSNVSVRVERTSPEADAYLRRWTRLAWILPLVRPFLGIWLIGELPYKAQDNGYHLFRWLREHEPRRRAYYVVAEDAPDRARLDGLGNVVLHGSREHVRVAFLASRIAGTHHAEYLLPSRHPAVVARVRAVRVFLRHGISGTKNMTANYGRFAPGFATDRFHVSSDRERRVAVDAFGYRPAQVRVTGLPRFDHLLAPLDRDPEGLLVIPTWREWLGNRDRFLDSEYRARWQEFLGHPRLARAMRDGLRVTFILHPNMRHYVDLFDVEGVRVLQQGEVDVQTLLREHAGLVTDYSSVAFDFALQRRPVLYFQFDQARFFGDQGSFLDLDADLPGTIVTDVDRLVEEVETTAADGFAMPEEHWARAQRSVRYHDRHNCERAAESVRTAGGPRVLWWRWTDRRWSDRKAPGNGGAS
ncbi:CDP-glycerol glycerophosphotransferase family protein [Isoptericola sp. NPDC056573]|uniref:CDP-glycerol glycerophosphotransferase family protein n=1 Tax=Isoptericola sp. NPDC056573 TaxID=3345868 RepID=UPI0036B1338D